MSAQGHRVQVVQTLHSPNCAVQKLTFSKFTMLVHRCIGLPARPTGSRKRVSQETGKSNLS